MAILSSFLQYLIIMIILIAVACLGWTVGKKIRLSKNAKAEGQDTAAPADQGDLSQDN